MPVNPKRHLGLEHHRTAEKYPRTYADVSAFDFKDKSCTDTFGIMLILDETGLLDPYIDMDEEIGRLFPLKEKIMWGSDIPW